MPHDDPLLTVVQIARLYGSGVRTVVSLVQSGQLPSLDGGRLIGQGRLDVPVIRRSWATALQKESGGASRRVDDRGAMHPAVHVALDFHAALDARDAAQAHALSTAATRADATPEEVLNAWLEELNHVLDEPSGVGSAVYSLAPLPAVAARIIADPPELPRAVTKPTPVLLLTALPLVEEREGWKVDMPLYRERESWMHLLSEPLDQPDPGR